MTSDARHWTLRLPVLHPTTEAQMREWREKGLREAGLYQVKPENRERLVWIVYPSGNRRINIWSEKHVEG